MNTGCALATQAVAPATAQENVTANFILMGRSCSSSRDNLQSQPIPEA
jgi:hypothetical protein